jgi:hypothetical protein
MNTPNTPTIEPANTSPKRFRRARIGVSVVFALLTLVLVVLWGRSYSNLDSFNLGSGHTYTTTRGWLYVDETFSIPSKPSTQDTLQRHFTGRQPGYIICSDITLVKLDGNGNSIPISALLLPFVAVIAAILPSDIRFSIRTLLIATTLVAATLGLAIWSSS